ncbi:hypothetical protein [Escherichia coli]|uniref:hypothetical protein n=1 Tax=Escherichia coli TaxID=562 RepID=UPI0037C04193
MRKFMLMAGLAVLLAGCGDDGIYGNYVNQQFGVRLDIQKDVIKFRDGIFTVKSWDESKNPSISPKRKTKISDLGLLKSKKSKMELFTKVRFLRKIRGVGNGK